MPADKKFQPDRSTPAKFLQLRNALVDGKEAVFLDFDLLDAGSLPSTLGLRCSLSNIRKLVRACLKSLEGFGDQPAHVLLTVLKQDQGWKRGSNGSPPPTPMQLAHLALMGILDTAELSGLSEKRGRAIYEEVSQYLTRTSKEELARLLIGLRTSARTTAGCCLSKPRHCRTTT